MRFLKKVFVVGLIVLIPTGAIFAQVDKGDKELSAAVSFIKHRDTPHYPYPISPLLQTTGVKNNITTETEKQGQAKKIKKHLTGE
jgi:predicted nucleic acid-binding protein